MKVTRVPLLALLVGSAILAPGSSTATGFFGKSGFLRVTKQCAGFTGNPGSHCTILSANIPEIPVDAKIYYSQPGGIPGLGLDSNVVLDDGNGNRAVGRCTLDLTYAGICTFSGGTGRFAGFNARVDVTPPSDGVTWKWLGTYEFESVGISWPRPR
jgi:hypothetical protein